MKAPGGRWERGKSGSFRLFSLSIVHRAITVFNYYYVAGVPAEEKRGIRER